jgi:hypothetical protein
MRQVEVLKSFGVHWIVVLSDGIVHPESVVICNMLFGCPSDAIVMLVNAKGVKHGELSSHDIINSLI